ncbi:Biosynthetic Aromatic amino acid aminotransferase beta [hydrothermal vent metagenome]|uniref:Biosynthetic Aromatic amino acid aminotransferase beta n=1 Tax=hydrothermal vent metagenome TaxID=652676 RepID=A0A3B0V2W4_9ZZZZ
MLDYKNLAVKGVQKLKPYIPGKPISELEREMGIANIIKLASNENPLGSSPLAMQAMQGVLGELELYPDGNGFELKKVLAAKHNIEMDCITLGNGSNDVLVMLTEAFLDSEHSAVYSQYCFAVYPIAVAAVGATHIQVPALSWDSDSPLGHDLDAMLNAITDNTRLVFVANPNNPTGNHLSATKLKNFISKIAKNIIVIIDEAYLEYSALDEQVDASLWLNEFPNLVVTRTFSKAYGLAGLRVGYALSNPDIANVINRIRQPFNVNSIALAAAEKAVSDIEFLEKSLLENHKGMQILEETCKNLNLRFVPSKGNFLLVDFEQDVTDIYMQLLKKGIITRPVANYGLTDCLRITIGTQVQMHRLDEAMVQVCG